MGEIVNLRLVKKQAARKAARDKGDANAALHGRTKAERAAQTAAAERASRTLDAHRREGGPAATDRTGDHIDGDGDGDT